MEEITCLPVGELCGRINRSVTGGARLLEWGQLSSNFHGNRAGDVVSAAPGVADVSFVRACPDGTSDQLNPHVFEVQRLVVDAGARGAIQFANLPVSTTRRS